MLSIQPTTLDVLSLINSSYYTSLILPETLSLIKNDSNKTNWIILEALLNNACVGLSLSTINPVSLEAELRSLVVLEYYRQKGIGYALFSATHDKLKDEKARSFKIIYNENIPFAKPLEKILAKKGWSPSQVYFISCYFDLKSFNPPWLHYRYKLPSSMTFFSWSQLNINDRNYIEFLKKQGRFLPFLSPFINEEQIDNETSVGLRNEKKLVGWCINYKEKSNVTHFGILFIENEYIHKGYGIQLLIHSINELKKTNTEQAYFQINVKRIDRSWWNFVKRRLIPLANQITRTKFAMYIY